MGNNVEVSVYCLAYNHEKYIRKTLESFVRQKTNFKFEVFVHDDASTDNTASIIREYEKRYPELFHVIYQTENQYSKGVKIFRTYIYPHIEGKYIATCEGDDYWTDENKLQMEYDYLESHRDCSLVCHAFKKIEADTEYVIAEAHIADEDCDLSAEKVILSTNNTNQLATWMWRRELSENRPLCYMKAKTGDTAILLHAFTKGKIHYINKVCSAYRVSSSGSWSQRIMKNKEKRIQHFKDSTDFYEAYDEETKYIYHDIISKKLDSNRYNIAWLENDFRTAIKCKHFRRITLKRKLVVLIGCALPKVAIKVKGNRL